MIVIGVVSTGAGFFGGMKYQQSKIPPVVNRQFTNRQDARNGQSFRLISGDIIATDDKSITVKLADGSSKIVFFSDQT